MPNLQVTSPLSGTGQYVNDGTNSCSLALRSGTTSNVGIGTTNPTQKLAVFPDQNQSAIIGRAHIGYMGHNDMAGFSHIDHADGSSYALLQHPDGYTHLNADTGKTMDFRIGNSVKMLLDSGGRLGIGTTSPNSNFLLDVNAGSSSGIVVTTTGGSGTKAVDASASTGYALHGYATDTGGTAVYGTAVPGAYGGQFNNSSASSTALYVGTGRVGLGTAGPSEKLDVNGNIKASGSMEAGGQTFVDSNGYIKPKSSSDASAPNSSLYINSTSGKLTFKDAGGTAHALY